MKKIITKFWGIGLIVVLLSTMFIAAAPTSAAEPLNWEAHIDGPSGIFYGLAFGTDVLDYDVDSTGMTMYAVTGATLLQSTFGGGMWTNIFDRLPDAGDPGVVELTDIDTADFVAMAPDDPNIVVVADASANATSNAAVAISVNGGATFSTMNFAGAATTTLFGLEVSPMVTGGYRFISVFGRDAADNTSVLYYYNYGAGIGAWTNAVNAAAWTGPAAAARMDSIRAVAFSPNFPSDYTAVALSEEKGNIALVTSNGTLRLHILSFSPTAYLWDAPISVGYPVIVTSVDNSTAFDVNSASIALLPEYDGGDESLRVAFVGASITSPAATEIGGIWRCYDYAPPQKIYGTTTGIGINSVAFDGTNLAAGSYDTNNVYRSSDPLANQPTLLPARAYKKIGVDQATYNDRVQVKFVGETLFGAKMGAASGLSKSLDYGLTWNDFALLDSSVGDPFGIGAIDDIYFSPDGTVWYLAAHDNGEASIYRMSMGVTRVLCVPFAAGAPDFIIRGIASDPNIIYVVDEDGTEMYYTADGGLSRWQKRTAPAGVQDMAVESKSIVYIGNGINVYKSINSGGIWALPVNTKLAGGNAVYTMLSLGENKLLIGGTAGTVAYSTDGAATWTTTIPIMVPGGVTNLQVAATGLAAGDYIFAAPGNSHRVYRAVVPPPGPPAEFKTMNVPDPAAANGVLGNRGLIYTDGILYALSENGTNPGDATWFNRTLTPNAAEHIATMWDQSAGANAYALRTPSALRTRTAGGVITLDLAINNWADWTGFGLGFLNMPAIAYYQDTLALTGPVLASPANGALVEINTIGGWTDYVNVSWSRPSKATAYEVQVALDDAFSALLNLDGEVIAADNDFAAEVPGVESTMSFIVRSGFLQPGQPYYWRVRASEPVTSGWSETRSFTVKPGAAAVPTLGAPINGSTITQTKPAFSFSPVAGSTLYQFQLSEGTAFLAPLVDETLQNTGIQPNVTLVPGTYFWRVRTIAPIEGGWSTVGTFNVAEPEPEPAPPVVVKEVPAPQITVTTPPAPPDIIIPAPPPTQEIAPGYIWAIIVIGAILVIAVIVLIVRTRRSV